MLNYDDLDAKQIECIGFIGEGEDSLILADVGTGKTVIGYTAGQEAYRLDEVKRWLVLAPLLVCTDTWANEPEYWGHLQNLSVAIACGTEAERIAALDKGAVFTVINFENLQWLLDRYPKSKGNDTLPFDGLIIDELDKLKTCSSKTFKTFRNRIGVFKKRIGMTGTVMPNDLTEVWGQMYMVDAGQRLGRSFYKWRDEGFYPTDFERRKWKPLPGTYDKVVEAMADITYRLPAPADIPPVELVTPHKMTLPDDVKDLYEKLEKDYYLLVEDDTGKKREVDAANAAVLSGKLQQICAGFTYVDRSKEAVWHSEARLDWADEMVNVQLADEQVLIVYQFDAEREKLKGLFPNLPILGGKVASKTKAKYIADWNAGVSRVMALHPDSASHGLNLQKSGAHHIAFLTVPWSGGAWKQVTGRLARRGQSAPIVYAHTAQFRNTIDEQVLETVTGRTANLQTFLDDLYAATAI